MLRETKEAALPILLASLNDIDDCDTDCLEPSAVQCGWTLPQVPH